MAECIEREATIKRIKEVYCVGCNSYNGVRCRACGTGDAIDIIEDAPTVDAIPVVRCRECKHHRDKNKQEQQYLVEDILICTSPDATDDCWNAVWPDHFCSYGERKEGAD